MDKDTFANMQKGLSPEKEDKAAADTVTNDSAEPKSGAGRGRSRE